MFVIFRYRLGVPLKEPTFSVMCQQRFPPVGRPEFEGLTETETRTLVFAEYNRVKKIHPDLKLTVHD